MQQRGDLSVEEILESIKRVIERENRETLQAERQPRGPAVPGPDNEQTSPMPGRAAAADVLDLGAEAMAPPAEEEAQRIRGDFRPSSSSGRAAVAPAAPAAPPKAQPDAPEEGEEEAGLVTEQTAHSVRHTLATFAALSQSGADAEGGSLLRETARELLRPMLAQWLEANLPGMVEALIRAEIARIAGIPTRD